MRASRRAFKPPEAADIDPDRCAGVAAILNTPVRTAGRRLQGRRRE
jgi:hypothetical protein